MLADQDCRIVVASPRALRILRRDHQQLAGQLLSEVIPSLASTRADSEAPGSDEDTADARLVELDAGEFARVSITPVRMAG